VPAPGLRVLVLAETFHPVLGGGETQGRLLCERLASRGHEVTVVTRRSEQGLARVDRLGSVRVARVRPGGKGGYKRWGMLGPAAWSLVRRRRDYDVALILGFRALGLVLPVLRLLEKPAVLKAESMGEMSGAFFDARLGRLGLSRETTPVRLLLAGRNRVLRGADAFVAISRAIRDEMVAAGVAPERITLIPNAVDTSVFRPPTPEEKAGLRRELGLASGETVFVYTGRLVRYKGLPLLLRAWGAVARGRAGLRLLLVGEGGEDMDNCEAELKEYVRRHGLAPSVTFTGGVADVHRYLQASDAFVFPTENEAFGISLVEAMACGLPCLASAAGGVTDIVTPGRDGLLVPPGDGAALEAGLRGLASDPAERARLGWAARATVVERFGVEAVVDEYARLLGAGGAG
jgi:glycosyltransferase involved in cell wall biosynthesis